MFKKNVEVNFFDMFTQSANYACDASDKLLDLLKNFHIADEKAQEIRNIEHEADNHFHNMYSTLHSAFIPPLERVDILDIAQRLDNVTDCIKGTSDALCTFNIQLIKDDAIKLAEYIVKICAALKETVIEFKDFKKSKTLTNKIIRVNSIEEEGDKHYRNAVKKLFSSDSASLDIMKWNEIYKIMEDTIDSCEIASNAIEDAILKNC